MSRCNVCFHSTVIRIKNVGLFLVGSSYVSPRRGGGGYPPGKTQGCLSPLGVEIADFVLT